MNPFDPLTLSDGRRRQLIDDAELREARRAGWLIDDPDRTRPRYFDGRFLAARDLAVDQTYFGKHQSALGRVGGAGVVAGLELSRGTNQAELVINPGHGVTPTGESVVLLESVTVDVSDVAAIQGFDAIFGLEVRPNAPLRNRSGLFVVALRNVEFTSNPVATYPSDLQVQRRIEDGEIIEATAVTLVPFEALAATDVGAEQSGRARLARELFLRRATPSLPQAALPIGVVALERGVIRWLDRYLVRRDASADDSLGFGLPHRAVRQAFLHQYREHLADVPAIRAASGASGPFAASEQFQVLPAFGPLPNDALQVVGDVQLVQSYFPAELDVELTIAPDDELAALQEEAVALEPIDLLAPSAELEDVAVLILLPLPRARFAQFVSRLEGRLTRAPLPRVSRATSRRSVVDTSSVLRLVNIQRQRLLPVQANLAPWLDALGELRERESPLYYVRRRRFSQSSFSFSRFQAFPAASPNPSETFDNDVRERLIAAGELVRDDADTATPSNTSPLDFLLRRTTNAVISDVEALFSRPLFARAGSAPFTSRLFINGAVAELAFRTVVRLDDLLSSSEARRSVLDLGDGVVAPEGSAPVRVRALSRDDVQKVRVRYARTDIGRGFALLVADHPELLEPANREVLAQTFRVPELDQQALRSSRLSRDELVQFGADVSRHVRGRDIGALRDLVDLRFLPPDEGAFPEIPGFAGSRVARELGEGALYLIVHTAAAAEPALQARISTIITRQWHDQPMIVSTLLMQLLAEALNLGFRTPQLTSVDTVLEALNAWDPTQIFRVPDNGTQTGGVLASSNNDVLVLLAAYEALELEPQLGFLTSVLEDNQFPGSLDTYRTLGCATRSAQLIRKLLVRAATGQARPLVDALRNALGNRNTGLTDIRNLANLESNP